MRKTVTAATMALLAFAGFSSDAFAEPSPPKNTQEICTAVYNEQQKTIDALAKAWNEAGLRDLFANNGCPGVIVTITKKVEPKGSKLISGLCGIKTWPPAAHKPARLECKADPL